MSLLSRKPTTRDEIEREIQNLTSALEELGHDAAHESRKHLDGLRSRLQSLWQEHNLDEHCAELSRKTRQVGRATKDCAREHPVATVALVAGAVALVGYLASRR
ncbi:DUF883 domain-containing protein [Pseudomonas sp. ABC1]|uniref:DUF883 family protein n=1 Tax=Pseudomonas sp. ABC1 TaxID=2748080 RepID=UPI0015C2F774|nr:DUF883 family protein [Pseudomonas sp. ABC1]QLF93760.1 DUF883 domain-containing protein [Pseudomonas sp. ABC1]